MSIQANGNESMFQSVDNSPLSERQRWIKVLARAPEHMLESALALGPVQSRVWLRRPESGLFMVQGRVGGTGNRFNVGEMTVTRCALRLSCGTAGVAYIQGRSHRRAEMAALADALLQTAEYRSLIENTLLEPVNGYLNEKTQTQARKAQTTRVDFFTVAREAGDPDTGAEDA